MSQSTGSAPDGTYSGRLEVVGGSTGRRHWPDAVKARVVQESFAPGASVSAVARRHGISPQQLTGWRRAARDGVLPLDGDQADTTNVTPAFVPRAHFTSSRPALSADADQVFHVMATTLFR
jgi:transposase